MQALHLSAEVVLLHLRAARTLHVAGLSVPPIQPWYLVPGTLFGGT